MIAKILYRNNVKAILNYVLEKPDSEILGFANTYSENNTDIPFFENTLRYMAERHDTDTKYTHITLNLSPDDELTNDKFKALANEYMSDMGYGHQPYIIVKHNDTNHPHVHIVTTRVEENCNLISTKNDFGKALSISRKLEKKYNLLELDSLKQERDFPAIRYLKNIDPNNEEGVKFYIQDIVSQVLFKYKLRNFKELEGTLSTYNIKSHITERNGKKGISFGIKNENNFETKTISGYSIGRNFSYPKLEKEFNLNSRQKIIYSHRKRLKKQLETTLGIFSAITPEALKSSLKVFNDTTIQLNYSSKGTLLGYTVHDKSKYLFKASEISKSLTFNSLKEKLVSDSKDVKIALESHSIKNFVEATVSSAIKEYFLEHNRENWLESEVYSHLKFKEIQDSLVSNNKLNYLYNLINKVQKKELSQIIKNSFDPIRKDLVLQSFQAEKLKLTRKIELMNLIESSNLFDVLPNKYLILQSLGTRHRKGSLYYYNSNQHSLPYNVENEMFPKSLFANTSNGFIRQNELMLNFLVGDNNDKYINQNSIFLPMIFPEIYNSLADDYRKKFDEIALKKFYENISEYHNPVEKKYDDHFEFLNSKGFFIDKKEGKFILTSIYTNKETSISLNKNDLNYLNARNDIGIFLKTQRSLFESKMKKSGNNLKELWVSQLIEKGIYDKAAFLIVNEGIIPALHERVLEYHQTKGLGREIKTQEMKGARSDLKKQQQKMAYAFNSLLRDDPEGDKQAFNGFKDEFTDYSPYKDLTL